MKARVAAAISTFIGVGLAVFAAFSFVPRSAHATVYMVNVSLGEAQAIATCNPNPAPAGSAGSGTVTYDDSTNMLSWNISYSNLSGPVIAAHFHGPATPVETAGVVVPISTLNPSVGSAVLTNAQEAELLGGLWYVNFHTAACGGGEIRGQVAGNGVGGVTQLASPAIAPLNATSDNSNHGMIGALAAAIAAAMLVGAGGAMLLARRVTK